MVKVLIFISKIAHYRIPLFNMIGEKYDLTLAHEGEELGIEEVSFKEIQIREKVFKGFIIHDKKIFKLVNEFDVVVSLSNLRCLYLMILSLNPKRKFKLIYWGIGVSASTKHNSKYDEKSWLDFFRFYFFRKADANIFYCDYPKIKYTNKGFPHKSLFVENNTVLVEENDQNHYEKSSILFIGSLYKNKGVDVLILNYHKAYVEKKEIYNLVIIGSGSELVALVALVKKLNISHKVFFMGAIYNKNIIEEEFKKAVLCISPNQAGLSVLTSFGYGVPFITHYNSITGGERFNIINMFNGICYYNHNQIQEIILESFENKEKFLKMGENAKSYYKSIRGINTYGEEFSKAIKYVVGHED